MGALIGIVGSRSLAWLIFGLGGLTIIFTLYQGVKSRGAQLEAAKWAATAAMKQAADRSTNFKIDTQTIEEGGDLQRKLEEIRQRWMPPATVEVVPKGEVK